MSDYSRMRSSEASFIPSEDQKKKSSNEKLNHMIYIKKVNLDTSKIPTDDEDDIYIHENYGDNSLWLFSNTNPFRIRLQKIISHKYFDWAVNIVILVNSIFLVLETIDEVHFITDYVHYVFISLYTIECIMKIIAYGFILSPNTYLRDPWNWIDLIVIITGLVSFIPGITFNIIALRMFRLIKTLKSFSCLPTMRIFISTLINSMVDLSALYFMMIFFFLLFAVLGLTIWSDRFHYRCRTDTSPGNQTFPIDPKYSDVLCGGEVQCSNISLCLNSLKYYPEQLTNQFIYQETRNPALNWGITKFGNIMESLFVVFLTTTGEGWPKIMIMYMNGYNYYVSIVFFIFCVVINYYFIINISVATMLYNFENAKQVNMMNSNQNMKLKKKPKLKKKKKERTMHSVPTRIVNQNNLRKAYRLKYIPIDLMPNSSKLKKFKIVCCSKIECFQSVTPQTEYHSKFKFGFYCYYLYQQPLLHYFFHLCITCNFILLAADRVNMENFEAKLHDILNTFFVTIFVLDILLHMFSNGLYKYVQNAWNIVEAIVILISLVEVILNNIAHTKNAIDSIVSILLLIRIVRLFRLFRGWRSFRSIAECIGHTLVRMVNFLFVFVIFLYMFSLIGYSFFHKSMPDATFNFDSFISSLISVIRIVILDHWEDIFFDCFHSPEFSNYVTYIFFIALIFFGNFTLLNIFISYLTDNYQKAKKSFDKSTTIQSFISTTIHFCLKEHEMQMRSLNSSSLKKEKELKKDVKMLTQFLQRLQNKEVIAEGKIEMLSKNIIDFELFIVNNDVFFTDVYKLSNNIKVMNFEKRNMKKITEKELCYKDYESEFHDFGLVYSKKPEFKRDNTQISRIEKLFDLKTGRNKKIKKTRSSPQLKHILNKKYKKSNKIFEFESISSIDNNTIHNSEYNQDYEIFDPIDSCRPLQYINKHNDNRNNASDSIIQNEGISDIFGNNYLDVDGFECLERQPSILSEPEYRRIESKNSAKKNKESHFNTTKINTPIFKQLGLLRENSTLKSVEEESESAITIQKSLKETPKTKLSLIRTGCHNCKEKMIPVIEHMKNSSLFIFHKRWHIRRVIRMVVYHKYFTYTIFGLLICNCVIMCFDNPWLDPSSVWIIVVYSFNISFNILFIIEGLLKIISDDFIFREKEEIPNFKNLKNLIDYREDLSNSATNEHGSINTSTNSGNVSWNKLNVAAKERYIAQANEMLDKRKAYLLNPENALDFICIIFSIIDMSITKQIPYLKLLRIFRTIKPIRILFKSQKLKDLIDCLKKSLPSLGNVLLIYCLFIVVYALLGVSLFKERLQYYCTDIFIKTKKECLLSGEHWYKNPNSFDNFLYALRTNFIIMVADDWGNTMATAGKIFGNRWVYWYYIIHIFIGYIFILNLFVAVLIQNFKSIKQRETNSRALSFPEKEWIHIQKMIIKVRPKYKQVINSKNKFEMFLNDIVQSVWFNNTMLVFTSLSILVLMLQYEGSTAGYNLILDIICYIFTFLYNLEIAMKFYIFKKTFFHSIWNNFDLVVLCLCDLMVVLNVLTATGIINLHILSTLPFLIRSFRILWALRMISSFSKLRSLIDTLVYILPSIGTIGILIFLLILIYANIGMNVFGTLPLRIIINDNVNFRNILSSGVLLFQLATKDNIGELMNELSYHDCRDPSSEKYQQDYFCFKFNITCYDDILVNYTSMNQYQMFSCGTNFSYFYLITFVLFGPLLIMNLCIVMVVEGFNESIKDNEGLFTLDYIEQFISTWMKYDNEHKQEVKPYEFVLIMKELQPSIGINYDRSIDNTVFSTKQLRDRINSYKELIHLYNDEKNQLNSSNPIERKCIREHNNCYILNGTYISKDLKIFTNDREVLMICNQLGIGFIDPTSGKKKKDNKEPISKIEPIDVIDKEYNIHFIDACLSLSRFSVCKMMNVTSNKLRLNVIGSYTKKIWIRNYRKNKDIIKAFFGLKKQREKISPILATKLLYEKFLKYQIENVRNKLSAIRNQSEQDENINNSELGDSIVSFEKQFDQAINKDNSEDKEMDKIIKNDTLMISRRSHRGSICNMSYFYNMKQTYQDIPSFNSKEEKVENKLFSAFQNIKS